MKRLIRKEEGFTLIEVIVAITIVIALAVGGFVSYGSLAEQAKRAVTKSAAQTVCDAANVYNQEGSKSPTEASDEFNQRHETVTTSLTGENCVTDTHEEGFTAERGSGCSSDPPGCEMIVDEWGIGTLHCDEEIPPTGEEEEEREWPDPVSSVDEVFELSMDYSLLIADAPSMTRLPYTVEVTRFFEDSREVVISESGRLDASNRLRNIRFETKS